MDFRQNSRYESWNTWAATTWARSTRVLQTLFPHFSRAAAPKTEGAFRNFLAILGLVEVTKRHFRGFEFSAQNYLSKEGGGGAGLAYAPDMRKTTTATTATAAANVEGDIDTRTEKSP